MLRPLLIMIAAAGMLFCVPQKITVLHINDTHGHLEPFMYNGTNIGGAARLATLIRTIRATNDAPVLLFHTGDTLSRGDVMTIQSGGAANLAVMEALGFDAYVPGNGDFYGGADDVVLFSKRTSIPFLGANITHRVSGERIFAPYLITNVGGIRAALLGLCFIRLEHPGSRLLGMQDAVECARGLYPVLASNDIVIALTHIGFEDDKRLAAALPIPVIIGGHSHTVLSPAYTMSGPASNSSVIAQAWEHYACLGRVDITVDTDTVPPTVTAAGRLLFVDASFPEDSEVAAIVRLYRERTTGVLAVSMRALTNDKSDASPAGLFAARAVQAETSADAALIDRNLIGVGIPQGNVTYADVFRMHSSRAAVYVIELNGDALRAAAQGNVYAVVPDTVGSRTYTVAVTEPIFTKLNSAVSRYSERRLDALIADHLQRIRTVD